MFTQPWSYIPDQNPTQIFRILLRELIFRYCMPGIFILVTIDISQNLGAKYADEANYNTGNIKYFD